MSEVTREDRLTTDRIFHTLGWTAQLTSEGFRVVSEEIARNRTAAEAAKDARIKELEAKLARAMDALRRCADASDGWELDMCNLHAHSALKEIEHG